MNRFFRKNHLLAVILVSLVVLSSIAGWAMFLLPTAVAPTLSALLIKPPEKGLQDIPGNSAIAPLYYPFLEVIESCGPYFEGTCVNMRSGPGEEYPVVKQLRTGVVLKVAETVADKNGRGWYKIEQDKELRYPERVESDWYVAADVVRFFFDDGDHELTSSSKPTNKRIVVSRSKQMLYAYDGDTLFMETPISTGLELTPTPSGTFTVFKMTPSRYMQGPLPGLPSDQYYDLPGVPWNLYFTKEGAVVHGAYWHNSFGRPWSHGCINLPLEKAKELYLWADIGMTVTVQD